MCFEKIPFSYIFFTFLLVVKMTYFNISGDWLCTMFLVSKSDPTLFGFTANIRPINRFKIKQQFPMPILEHELSILSNSRFLTILDLPHGYEKRPLAMFTRMSVFHHQRWHIYMMPYFAWHHERCYVFAVNIGGTVFKRTLPKYSAVVGWHSHTFRY